MTFLANHIFSRPNLNIALVLALVVVTAAFGDKF